MISFHITNFPVQLSFKPCGNVFRTIRIMIEIVDMKKFESYLLFARKIKFQNVHIETFRKLCAVLYVFDKIVNVTWIILNIKK